MTRFRSSLTDCTGRFCSTPGDQFEDAKKYLYWHSWIGTGYSDYEDYLEHQEAMKEEAQKQWANTHPMVKYLTKLHDAVLIAYRDEAERTKYPAKRSKEFWRLDDAIRSINARLDYWMSK